MIRREMMSHISLPHLLIKSLFQINVLTTTVKMEAVSKESRSEDNQSKIVTNFIASDFVKKYKKSISLGLTVIGVIAVVSAVLSVNYSGKSSKLSRQERIAEPLNKCSKQLSNFLSKICIIIMKKSDIMKEIAGYNLLITQRSGDMM